MPRHGLGQVQVAFDVDLERLVERGVIAGEAAVNAALLDAALVFALLAAISGAAFAQRAWREEEATHDDD